MSPRFSAIFSVAIHPFLFSFARSPWKEVVGGIRSYSRAGVALVLGAGEASHCLRCREKTKNRELNTDNRSIRMQYYTKFLSVVQ